MNLVSTQNVTSNAPQISASGLRRERHRIGRQWLAAGLLLGDLVCVWAAMMLGFWMKFYTPLGEIGLPVKEVIEWSIYIPQFILAGLLFVGWQLYNDRYSRAGLLASPLGGVRESILWGALLALVSLGLKVDPAISRLFILFSTLTLAGLLLLWRFAYTRRFIAQSSCREWVQRQALIVGWNSQVPALLQRSEDTRRLYPLKAVGIVGDIDATKLAEEVKHYTVTNDLEAELVNLLKEQHYDEVILAEGSVDDEAAIKVQEICGRELIDFALLPAKISSLARCLSLESVQGVPLLTQSKRPLDRIEFAVIKRAVDVLGALVGLFLFAPVIALFALIVYCESPGAVFYRQTRTGRGGEPFQIIKIRSMRLDAEGANGAQWCAEDDPRRLKIGALMRRLNIDELPQFWNVLKGDMSLVGPRPERPELIQSFKSEVAYYNIRHTVKPGITGWAQVCGWRGDTCLQSRIACDLEYIESASLWFDIRILLMTFRAFNNAY
ncbi:MAG: sugar transferase [Verrucomicrobiota bacterium]|nr:sugar transferase [Verrucomicrobiota bacterium]